MAFVKPSRPQPPHAMLGAAVAVCVFGVSACRKVEPRSEQGQARLGPSAPSAPTTAPSVAAPRDSPDASRKPPADASTDAARPPAQPQFAVESGTLSVAQDGHKATIARGVDGFWPVPIEERQDADHRTAYAVTYAKADGAGGYENEGQSLYLWAPGYREGRKLVAEYFQIQRVESLAARSGRTVLLIVMKDGGLGATHVAFADPERGELFRADGADIVQRDEGSVRIGWFRDEDWERFEQDAAVHPVRTERLDLDAMLRRPAMHNPRQP